jgi:barstar (barnase inhibitor)
MAPFGAQDKKEETLDWVILRDGGIALYWRREYLDQDLEWFRQQNYQIYSFDCEKWTNGGMHVDFERSFNFPSYYGHNFDALNDCLQEDLSVPELGGAAVVLKRFDAFLAAGGGAHRPDRRPEGEILLDLFACASRYFLLTGRRLATLVQSDDPRIQFDSLGGIAAMWNRRERLNKNRGL